MTWTRSLWVELWADVDREDPPAELQNVWRVTVWETDSDREIDPEGKFFDPKPGMRDYYGAYSLAKRTVARLKARGFHVVAQISPRSTPPIKRLKEEMQTPRGETRSSRCYAHVYVHVVDWEMEDEADEAGQPGTCIFQDTRQREYESCRHPNRI